MHAPAVIDYEDALSTYFDRHGARGWAGAVRAAAHPRASLRALACIRRLDQLVAAPSRQREGRIVRLALLREDRIARFLVRGTTAVLVVPADPAQFLRGSSRSKSSFRNKLNRAKAHGVTWRLVGRDEERARLLSIGNEYERTHPRSNYRNAKPDNRNVDEIDLWLVAEDAEGRPVLLVMAAIDGEWSALRYFRTLAASEEASLARYLMTAVLVEQMAQRSVRYIADTKSPIGLDNGLRLFQRRVGFRLFRVRLLAPVHAPAPAPAEPIARRLSS